jgi:hypothetical protein
MTLKESILTPPLYCQYASGKCDQIIDKSKSLDGFFIYPSEPIYLSKTISETVRQLQQHSSLENWLTWQKLNIDGQIIFCEICKAIRASKLIVANITTTNFNVLFELGYAIGLHKPVLPVRDSSFGEHKKLLDEVGIFDTLGFQEFSNSNDLVSLVNSKKAYSPPIQIKPTLKKNEPIFYMRSPIDTDGSVKLLSCLKKCYFRFRVFDAREVSRLSLHDAYKQTLSSVSVIAHLISPERTGATAHNARAAFVCGMALAAGKHVLMLQEGTNWQPIDYRDIVRSYDDHNNIPYFIEEIVRLTADTVQSIEVSQIPLPKGLLERIDLGDVAAENEIQTLANYFVKTPQFQQARQGHARMVIGRKGSGKTALFYGIRNQLKPQANHLVLDLKPEGHQFTKLREMVLTKLSAGLKLHALTAFWHYLLLLEIANKIIEKEVKTAYRDDSSIRKFEEIKAIYNHHVEKGEREGDFSERLMKLVNRLISLFPKDTEEEIKSTDLTKIIYAQDISNLQNILTKHIQENQIEEIWILFDNIDKGFPTHGIQEEDILMVRCLLEASRKVQQSFGSRNINCTSIIFLRRDVYDYLVNMTPDRGKETYVNLDWSDIELIKELLHKRFRFQAYELESSFEDSWSRLFNPHVSGENSFNYILSRTFLRPRDVLNFVRKSIQIGVSRGHERVEQDDFLSAEKEFSEDMLNELSYEMRDIFPEIRDPMLAFIGANNFLSYEDIEVMLLDVGIPEDKIKNTLDILLWFSFLGVRKKDDEHYAYQFLYNIDKLKAIVKDAKISDAVYSIHPAFRYAFKI